MPAVAAFASRPDLPEELRRLGLRPDDAEAFEEVLRTVRDRPNEVALVERMAEALRRTMGRFPGEPDRDLWPGYDAAADPYGTGVLALLALAVTAPDLQAFHRSRGVPAE